MNISRRHKTEIHKSGDGSHTLYSTQFNQFFHNPNGAIAESRYHFFEAPRLKERMHGRDTFFIFEAGFGTGLNLLLLLEMLSTMKSPPAVTYCSVEAFPVSETQASALNYPEYLNLPENTDLPASVFRTLRPGLNTFTVHQFCTLELFIGRIEQIPPLETPCDAIFFDPFSPDVNPDFWTPEIFGRLKNFGSSDVVLSTYCAATSARAAMAVAGWHPYRLPGILGKREMTVAMLNPENRQGGSPVNRERLKERYRNGEFNIS